MAERPVLDHRSTALLHISRKFRERWGINLTSFKRRHIIGQIWNGAPSLPGSGSCKIYLVVVDGKKVAVVFDPVQVALYTVLPADDKRYKALLERYE